MDFKEGIKAGGPSRAVQDANLLVAQSPDDDENCARPGFPGLKNLQRMDEKILAKAGQSAPARRR